MSKQRRSFHTRYKYNLWRNLVNFNSSFEQGNPAIANKPVQCLRERRAVYVALCNP